jgi:hypothetical protein
LLQQASFGLALPWWEKKLFKNTISFQRSKSGLKNLPNPEPVISTSAQSPLTHTSAGIYYLIFIGFRARLARTLQQNLNDQLWKQK